MLADGYGLLFRRGSLLPESFADEYEGEGFKVASASYAGAVVGARLLVSNALRRKRSRVADARVWFTDTWSEGYYHWVGEALPRLAVALEFRPDILPVMPGRFRASGEDLMRALTALEELPKRG